jgi:PAS domain S-box-containing protein
MKRMWRKYILYTLGFVILFWLIDNVIDYLFMYENRSFFDLLFLDIPMSELYFRLIFIFIAIVFAVFVFRSNIRIKKMQQEMEKQKEKYRILAEYSNDVIWTLGMDGRFQYISPSVERLRGYTAEEVMNEPFEKALTPRSFVIITDLFDRFSQILIENPGKIPSAVTEIEQTCKDGSTVWTEASVSTIMGKDNKPKLFLGVSRNISDRKKRETELRQSEENYRLLAETSMDIILLFNMDGYMTYANKAFFTLSSYSANEIATMNIRDIVSPKYYILIDEHVKRRVEGDFSRYLYEIEIRTKDERLVPLEVASSPIHLNKLPVAILVSGRDITERRQAHRKLVENERRFRKYIENAPLPVFMVSSSGRIKFVNEAACTYLDYEKLDLLGKNILEFTSLSDDSQTNKILKEDNAGLSFELSFNNSRGKEFIAIVRSSYIERNTFLIYAIDITARIKAEQKTMEKEAEIRKMNAELEETVRNRTLELQKTNKELEAFTYSVSHDLRAPLSHIKAFSKLLQNRINKFKDPKSENYLETLSQSVDKMNQMIDDFLIFSKMNKAVLDKTEFDLSNLVSQVIFEFKHETKGREIEWEIEKLGNVYSDKNMIRLVWINLISNALKYTSRKEKAEIHIGKIISGEKTIYFIKDNGAGFDEKYKNKLFSVFQRLHSDTEFPGTGIGLANVKRIIESHGGEVWGQSPGDEGAEFFLTLPLSYH